jgi:nickel/cobalt exporter
MILLALSAAFVGFMHSMAPGHWLPVVMLASSRKWSVRQSLLAAAISGSGHILVSVALGVLSVFIESQFIAKHDAAIEHYASVILVAFGLVYAVVAWRRHSSCHGHEHHGPDVEREKEPLILLFSSGMVPCVAVLPIFAAAAAYGPAAAIVSMVTFAIGVMVALGGATLVVSRGLMKLDHPLLEHYGDVITGLAVALMGIVLYLLPHHHAH